MNDRFNTIAGWVLFAGIVALGSSIVSGEAFKSERPEKMGYPIPGVVAEGEGGGEADKPITCYLAAADAAKGEQVFKKCTACHNADKGGANALGPNLWGVVGEPVGKGHGFAFSEALASKGGTWDFNTLSDWLANPKKFAPGTKMTFAGLGTPEDRANVIAFLNAHGDAPAPMPAAGPECEAGAAVAGAAPGNPVTPPTGDASTPAQGGGTAGNANVAATAAATANAPAGQENAVGGEQPGNR